eukprot:TRINITY_DN17954_c0_g1_i1.p1 TRINITY_DN17954_c0_g1~~TRINITY_DN17954_c0_g1_i1.p1  ORF type:complete len:119 (-),score=26.73 TRINITY_DN17954_c0_g1_i1:207-563(-)
MGRRCFSWVVGILMVAAQMCSFSESRMLMLGYSYNLFPHRSSSSAMDSQSQQSVNSYDALETSWEISRFSKSEEEGRSSWQEIFEEKDKHKHTEVHPGDRLLRFHKADGSKSYILGGY